MAAPDTKDKPRADRKLPVLKLQKIIASIEKRITASEQDATPAEQKLKAKELIGLANSVAGIGRVLRDVDKEILERGQRKLNKSGNGGAWEGF
jgi:hypothetical protein